MSTSKSLSVSPCSASSRDGELPGERRVRAQKAHPGAVGTAVRCRQFLCDQYLTRQAFLAMILVISSIANSTQEAMSHDEHPGHHDHRTGRHHLERRPGPLERRVRGRVCRRQHLPRRLPRLRRHARGLDPRRLGARRERRRQGRAALRPSPVARTSSTPSGFPEISFRADELISDGGPSPVRRADDQGRHKPGRARARLASAPSVDPFGRERLGLTLEARSTATSSASAGTRRTRAAATTSATRSR